MIRREKLTYVHGTINKYLASLPNISPVAFCQNDLSGSLSGNSSVFNSENGVQASVATNTIKDELAKRYFVFNPPFSA